MNDLEVRIAALEWELKELKKRLYIATQLAEETGVAVDFGTGWY